MAHYKHIPELVEFHRERVERLRRTTDILAPWEAYPTIPRGSIGWRMGSSESFIIDWGTWLRALTPEQRDDYRKRHPEPESWSGIYEQRSPQHDKTWDEFWDDEFKTKYEMWGPVA